MNYYVVDGQRRLEAIARQEMETVLDRVAVGYLSVLCARDCACWECGTVVKHHTLGYRRRFGDQAFMCRPCVIREASWEESDA